MKIKLLLIGILLIASFLRLYHLGSIPPSLTPDEAALGYNAYSILNTGKDEHGEFLPLIFSSFGDYKPGLYVYASIPFVAAFGLNEWSVRLPSAVSGILSVYLIYLIVFKFTRLVSLSTFTAFTAATSPWLVHLSRGAWETNFALMLTLSGIYFFLKSLSNSKFLVVSSILFSLTFLTYQGAKLSTSVTVIILVLCFWKESRIWIVNKNIHLVKSILLGLIVTLPVILSFFQGRTGRLEVNSLFSYPRPYEYTVSFLEKANEKIGDVNYYIFHSEPLNFTRGILGRWFNHYSGRFLFFEGDYQNPRHSSPNHGVMLLFDVLLLPFGFVYLIKTRKLDKRFKIFVFSWLLISPLPAALSRDQVHAVRAINLSVPLVMLSALGFYYLILIFNKRRYWNILGYGLLISFYSVSLVYFLDSYFVHMPKHNAKYWYYGYKEAVEEVNLIKGNYNKIIFQQSYSQPYIYFLFYTKYDPYNFQRIHRFVGNGADVSLLNNLDKIEFKTFSWPPAVSSNEKTLIIGDSVVIPDDYINSNFKLIKEIKYPDGVTTAFRVIESQNL